MDCVTDDSLTVFLLQNPVPEDFMLKLEMSSGRTNWQLFMFMPENIVLLHERFHFYFPFLWKIKGFKKVSSGKKSAQCKLACSDGIPKPMFQTVN